METIYPKINWTDTIIIRKAAVKPAMALVLLKKLVIVVRMDKYGLI